MSKEKEDFIPENVLPWWESACQYDKKEDIYHAVKLFRRIIKENPLWIPPYLRIISIYTKRKEWKQVYAFSKRVLSLDASLKGIWWLLGVSSEKTGKLKVASRVWTKFGLESEIIKETPICLKISIGDQSELVWAYICGPACAKIINIPLPASKLGHKDIVFYDMDPIGYQIIKKKRHPIFQILAKHKTSFYNTYSCNLEETDENDLKKLEVLCHQSGLGFDVWSLSTRAMNDKFFGDKREYYFMDEQINEGTYLVGIAARKEEQAKEVLKAWEIITLKRYTDFIFYENNGHYI